MFCWTTMFSSNATSLPSSPTLSLFSPGSILRVPAILLVETPLVIPWSRSWIYPRIKESVPRQNWTTCRSAKHDILISAVVQSYDTNVAMEDVLLGNDVLFKCNIPSFISDFVSVIGWVDSEGSSHSGEKGYLGNSRPPMLQVDPD